MKCLKAKQPLSLPSVADERRNVGDTELADLAARITDNQAKIDQGFKITMEHVFECGRLLAIARIKVRHGSWEYWVRDNTSLSPRTWAARSATVVWRSATVFRSSAISVWAAARRVSRAASASCFGGAAADDP